MERTRSLSCAVTVLLAALSGSAHGLDASEQFSLTVTGSRDHTESDCHVVNLVGLQEYTIQAPPGKEFDLTTIKWSGVPGAANMNGNP